MEILEEHNVPLVADEDGQSHNLDNKTSNNNGKEKDRSVTNRSSTSDRCILLINDDSRHCDMLKWTYIPNTHENTEVIINSSNQVDNNNEVYDEFTNHT